MAEKDQILKEKIDHNGYFDFKSFYSFAHSWFNEENYDVAEEKYSENVSGANRNIKFEWACTKQISDYFKLEMKIKFEVTDLSEVEVEIDGKKKKTNKGKVSVEVKGSLIRDPDSKWDGTHWTRFLRDVYSKYVVPGRIDNMTGKVNADVIAFKEQLKAFLELSGKRK